MEGVEVETPVGVESVPVTVTVNKDADHGGVGRRQGNEDVESAGECLQNAEIDLSNSIFSAFKFLRYGSTYVTKLPRR